MNENLRQAFDTTTFDMSKVVLSKEIGRGGNARVFDIEGNPELVAKVFNTKWDGWFPMMQDLKKTLDNLPSEVQTPKIFSVLRSKEDKTIVIMERATGTLVHSNHSNYETWSRNIARLATINLNHYVKLIMDQKILISHNLKVDPSKPDNIFYDSEIGFTYIDLNVGGSNKEHSLLVPLLDTATIFNRARGKLTPIDKQNILMIIELLRQAGDVFSNTQDDFVDNTLLSQILDVMDESQ